MARPRTMKPTHAPHAGGYTLRPMINGKRHYIGYWPTEAGAIEAAKALYKFLETPCTEQQLERFVTDIKRGAQEARDKAAEAKKINGPFRKNQTFNQKVEELHQRIAHLTRRVEALEGKQP